ncbi:MAG: carboxymuconolactone decarboxylase family protein [Martelella sp.]|uniref:carboxymuconolactone decarboxylase family protein n=1 Tax=Martelella sp. TaxID=1969699 RepID=UPI003242DDC3
MEEDRTKEALKAEVIKARGYWHPFHQGLLEHAPEYLRAYLDFQDAPARTGLLEPKVREFMYIAADGAVSHLYASGLSRHVEMALEAGATAAEIIEVIQLTMLTAQAPHDMGLPMLAEEMARRGQPAPPARQSDIRAEHEAVTGRWPRGADLALALTPGFAQAYLAYERIPYESGPLPRKVKEFVRIAVAGAPTTLDRETLREAIGAALDAGASPEEVAEVLQLSSAIAIHTCTGAIPALMNVLDRKKEER